MFLKFLPIFLVFTNWDRTAKKASSEIELNQVSIIDLNVKALHWFSSQSKPNPPLDFGECNSL